MTKTGSTAVEAAIAPLCDIVFTGNPKNKHIQVRKFERFIAPYLATLTSEPFRRLCVFREPTDWLNSWYRYRGRPEIDGHANSTAGISFAEFVAAYLAPEPPAFARVGRQSDFVRDRSGAVAIDLMYRYDRVETLTAFLSDTFKTDISLPQRNVSPDGDRTLPEDLQQALAVKFAEDYEIYNSLTS